MQSTSKNITELNELQMLVRKVPLQVCCITVLPEFEVRWRDVSRAVRNAKLPMNPASVARVLCKHVGNSMPRDEIVETLARLRLKLIANQKRTWHLIKLSEQLTNEPVNVQARMIPSRVVQALGNMIGNSLIKSKVHTVKLGDLIYISIQMISRTGKLGKVLYVATPPGEPVALVSLMHSRLLKACVQGIGYRTYEDACLHGYDIKSLLRIFNSHNHQMPERIATVPEYNEYPTLARSGIDYTGRELDDEYASRELGPDPPKISKLIIEAEKQFFDPKRLNKKMKVKLQIKSENIAETLQNWVHKGIITPTSYLFSALHKMKSNNMSIPSDVSDVSD